MRPLLRQAAAGRRVADVVVQLWLRGGETTWLLAHVEVQGRYEEDFSRRMYDYAALLHARFLPPPPRRRSAARPPAVPPPDSFLGIAVLSDPDPAWRPAPYRWGWRDDGLHYRFRVLKLADWRERAEELAADGRPFGWVIRAWLATQAAGRSIDAQVRARQDLVLQLLAARRQQRLDAERIVAIVAFLDATTRLPDELLVRLDDQIRFGKDGPMEEYLNRWERQGLQRGLQQGLLQGLTTDTGDTVLRQLSRKGLAPDATTEARVRALNREQLPALADALLGFERRAGLDIWLAQHAPSE